MDNIHVSYGADKVNSRVESKDRRIYSLDVLRIIATLGIVFYHYQQVFNYTPSGILNFHYNRFNCSYLVEFFFILSGFLSFYDIDRLKAGITSFTSYVKKKYARLLPAIFVPCIVYTVVCYLFRSSVGNSGWYFDTLLDIPATIVSILGMQVWGVFYGTLIDYPIWYVDVLLFCYIIFAIITKIARRKNISPVYGFIVMIFLGIIVWNGGVDRPFLTMQLARGYYAFFTGVLVGYWYNYEKNDACLDDKDSNKTLGRDTGRAIDKIPALVICLATVVVSIMLVTLRTPWFGDYDVYIYTFIAYPALMIAFLNPFVRKCLDFKFIGAVAKVTYDVFVWHLVVFFIGAYLDATGILRINFESYGAMFILAGISIVVGIFAYLFLDKLVIRMFKKVLKIIGLM